MRIRMVGRTRYRDAQAVWARVALLLCIAGLARPAPALAQQICPQHNWNCATGPQPADRHDWQDHATVLGINAVLGGLTAGVGRHSRGGSFWRGFAAGAAGGSTIYVGKRLSAEHFRGAGLAGRQVAAVGASVVDNASEDRDLLERVLVPIGPFRFHLDRSVDRRIRTRLDVMATGILLYRVVSSASTLDRDASISAGTPVFWTEDDPRAGWHGSNSGGVILLRDAAESNSIAPDMVFAHERIHVIQYDQAMHNWGAPAERWLLQRIPGGDWLSRHVDLGLIALPVMMLNEMISYDNQPWEREAHFFSGSR